jgi:hypothetical protein
MSEEIPGLFDGALAEVEVYWGSPGAFHSLRECLARGEPVITIVDRMALAG